MFKFHKNRDFSSYYWKCSNEITICSNKFCIQYRNLIYQISLNIYFFHFHYDDINAIVTIIPIAINLYIYITFN